MSCVHGARISPSWPKKRRRDFFSHRCSGTIFFHADMHPGNIFVQLDDPENPRLCRGRLWNRRHSAAPRSNIIWRRISWLFSTVTMRRGGRAPRGVRMGAGRGPGSTSSNPRWRTVCEPIFKQALEGYLLRAGSTAVVRDGAPLRHANPTAADPAAKDPPQYRRSGAGKLYPELDLWKDRAAHSAILDARKE